MSVEEIKKEIAQVRVNEEFYNKFILAKGKESIRGYASSILENSKIEKEDVKKYYKFGKTIAVKEFRINVLIKEVTMEYIRKMEYYHQIHKSDVIRIMIAKEIDKIEWSL